MRIFLILVKFMNCLLYLSMKTLERKVLYISNLSWPQVIPQVCAFVLICLVFKLCHHKDFFLCCKCFNFCSHCFLSSKSLLYFILLAKLIVIYLFCLQNDETTIGFCIVYSWISQLSKPPQFGNCPQSPLNPLNYSFSGKQQKKFPTQRT